MKLANIILIQMVKILENKGNILRDSINTSIGYNYKQNQLSTR